jgi:hypothetical protein
MAKGKKSPRGANGFVNVRISKQAYEMAQAQVSKLEADLSKQSGMTVKLRPSSVIERMLLGK